MKSILLLTTILFIPFFFFAQSDCNSIGIHVLNASCAGAADGEIHLNMPSTGGYPPYQYLWSTGDTTSYIDDLVPGEYLVTVTDSLGFQCVLGAGNHLDSLIIIPDGNGTAVESERMIDWFDEGEVVQSGEDIKICAVMEHSWMRDLDISLICPDGNSILLHEFPGQIGGEIFLGEPVEGDGGAVIPGIGYQYCWTMSAETLWYETPFLDTLSNGYTIPSGDYKPKESFYNLVGCPLNGVWTLHIADLWPADNGVLFDWGMTLNGKSGPVSIQDGTEDCTACEEEYYCMDWLQDTIIHNSLYLGSIEKAKWGDRTVFVGLRLSPVDDNLTVFFDCSGRVFLQYGGWLGGSIVDNSLFDADEITDRELIWAPYGTPPTILAACEPLAVNEIIVPELDCYDSTASICAEVSGGTAPYTLHWTSPDGLVSTGDCIDNLRNGVYTVVAVDVLGHTTDTLEVVANVPEEIAIEISLTPDSLGANCIPTIGVTGGVPPYAIDWEYLASANWIVVTVADAKGCLKQEIANCTITQVDDIRGMKSYSIFPNPTTGELHITAELRGNGQVQLLLRNTMGEVLLSQKYRDLHLNTTLDLGVFPSGLYLLELQGDGVRLVRKVIVE